MVGSCEDRNAISIVEEGDSAIDVVCYCRHGFISSGGLGQLLQNESDYCVECMSASNIIVSSDQFTMKFNEGIFEEKYPTLSRHDPDAKVEIELFTREAGSTEENEIEENFKTDSVGNSKMEYNFFRLQPGYRYTVKMTQKEDTAAPVLQCPIVTSCSCDHKSSDRTGRPGTFQIRHRFLVRVAKIEPFNHFSLPIWILLLQGNFPSTKKTVKSCLHFKTIQGVVTHFRFLVRMVLMNSC